MSDRNVIQLVIKLKEQGVIEVRVDSTHEFHHYECSFAFQLIHGTDGKEYLTPDQLEKEVMEEVKASGGRVALNDIQVCCAPW